MTDIFREVEEDVRRERYEQLWKKYGDYVIAGAALLVIAAAGFQLWRVYEQRQQQRAAVGYATAMQLLEMGQSTAAAQTFAKLADTAPHGYAMLAQLQKANALYASGNVPEAVDLYKQVAAKGDPLLAPIARIRAAWASADSAPRSEIQSLVGPLADLGNPWHPLAREILAYAAYRSGDTHGALTLYQQIAKDPNAPRALRQRATAMAVFIGAGGEQNFGSVPMPAAPKPGTAGAAPAGGPKPQ